MATLFSLQKDVATSKFASAICYALAITMVSSVINALFGSTNGDGYVVHVSCNAMQAMYVVSSDCCSLRAPHIANTTHEVHRISTLSFVYSLGLSYG
eukprot:1104050_1